MSSVCPQCKSGDHLWDGDQIEYKEYFLVCANCGWEGSPKDLIEVQEDDVLYQGGVKTCGMEEAIYWEKASKQEKK